MCVVWHNQSLHGLFLHVHPPNRVDSKHRFRYEDCVCLGSHSNVRYYPNFESFEAVAAGVESYAISIILAGEGV